MSSEMPIMGYATESKGPKVLQTLKPASRLVFEFLDSFIILVNLPNKSFHCYLERFHVSDIRTHGSDLLKRYTYPGGLNVADKQT